MQEAIVSGKSSLQSRQQRHTSDAHELLLLLRSLPPLLVHRLVQLALVLCEIVVLGFEEQFLFLGCTTCEWEASAAALEIRTVKELAHIP